MARALRDVAVREPVNRSPPPICRSSSREIARASIEIGHLTTPEVTAQGLQMFALCDKKQTNGRNRRPSSRCATQIFSKRFEAESKRFLEEMRKSGDDRIQDQMSGAGASAGVDARRTGRHRSRPHARRCGSGARELDLPPFYLIGDADFLAQRARACSASTCRSQTSTPARGRRRLRPRVAGRAARPCRSPPSPASRTQPARRPRSPRSAAPSPTCSPAAPPPSSPIRSPRTCSTGPALPSPATPNFSPGSPQERPASRRMPVMMLWSPELAVVPVTIHVPLQRRVRAADARDLIVETGRIVARDLAGALRHRAAAARGRRPQSACRRRRRARRGGSRDRRAGGRAACGRGHRRARAAAGRHACFTPAARAAYDVALCMYHDQALIPIKTLAFDHARQRHARPAFRAHLARPRHRLRHRRHRARPIRRA